MGGVTPGQDMRDDSHLGAGDPGALDSLFGAAAAESALAGSFRRHGWRAARLDPLAIAPRSLSEAIGPEGWALAPEAVAALDAIYCGALGWEIGHVQTPERHDWLAATAEAGVPVSQVDRARAAWLIAAGEAFEATTLKRLPTVKTFGMSGAESFLVAIDTAIRDSGAREAIVGGMHRGRLTQLALVFGKPLARLIAEVRGAPDIPATLNAASDVPYHLGWQGAREDGVRVWVAPHPSHLSLVAPVAMGRARAAGGDALPLMLHTDAAFAGQGVNMELLQLSGLPAYAVGGSVHLVLDNQVGFTTGASEARTSRTAADVAKMIEAPVLHVNGDEPDAVIRAARAAVAYRTRFGADIVVRVIGYRRRGHNEMDEPRFTQPDMQGRIDALAPLSARYVASAGLDAPDLSDFKASLDAAFAATPRSPNDHPAAPGLAAGIEAAMLAPVATGLDPDRLRDLGRRLATPPPGFALHPKVAQFLERRRAAFDEARTLDWATAEAVALASLLTEGHPVRLGGQDTARGAFAQRHLVLHDQTDGRSHAVLAGFGARAEVFNSPLIENAVLGFEYGYSTATPDALTVWEAQFGDFLNVCQPMFDQYVTGGEDRWLMRSGLVMLLPHGFDGGGPDHSTGHVERILARCAKGNIQVANPTTPANFFHLLRRQIVRPLRKPLVTLSPKLLLRHAACVSPLADFGPGTGFIPVIAEERPSAGRVILCSGKIALRLAEARAVAGLDADVAIVRLEQLHPFPAGALGEALSAWPGAQLVWAQEEPENLGPFGWLDRRLEAVARRRVRLVSRAPAASPAVGWGDWHNEEERCLLASALDMEDTR